MKIDLPPETVSFKAGGGSEIANAQCLICHSVEYVTMQPPLPRTFWAASVKKMKDKFGAPLPDEQVEPVVNYLVKNYGQDTNRTPVTLSTPAQIGDNQGRTVNGEAIATKYGCLGCHNVSTKIVGPAYRDVAAKYHDDSAAFSKIADQIHQGGSGKWGPVIMPPFPMITDAETKTLADWILSRK
ncbi:MAG TPA: c-type cytochrome [Candidatus Binatia bacterium]|jgi:cytochrome c551/c552|nr:c-type cytochrome [Candidatus Binatia bacterium]